MKAAGLVAVLLLVGGQVARLMSFATESHAAGSPLDLPGATRLRLPPRRVAVLTALARELRAAPDTFLCTDGFYSMYFWTAKDPPTRILIGHTIDLYTPQQTDAVAEALLARPQALLLLSPSFPQLQKPFYRNLLGFFEVQQDRPVRHHEASGRKIGLPLPDRVELEVDRFFHHVQSRRLTSA